MEYPAIGSLLPAMQLLHDRGHRLHLAYQWSKSAESQRELDALHEECPGIVFSQLPTAEPSGWGAVADWLRFGIDYVRYLEPRFRDATRLRARAARTAPPAIRRLGRLAAIAGPRGIAALRRGLQLVEGCLTPPASTERFVEQQVPDVVIPTHLLSIGAEHADYLRAAKRLGIHTVFPVRGWDNLTNKGLLRDAPELMLVWNDLQAQEAEELHGVPRDRIRLTGAPSCDHWFGWAPSRDRDTFCREIGLPADRPIVLYVCSSGFVARDDEVAFVRRWIDGLRARGGPLGTASFLIRPHPLNAAQWADAALGEDVRVWPRFGEAPHDERSRRNFFDSIYHAAAVVGINTTAQIESAIVGRPVHTLLAEEFRETQQGTLHFHHLQAEGFGHLLVGRTFEEHGEQLEASLRGRADDGRNDRFLRRFVRPLGLDRSATELLVEAIEELGSQPAPASEQGPWLAPVVRLALTPLAVIAGRKLSRRRRTEDSVSTPLEELRQEVRTRAMHKAGIPVVAGPWLGDEIGELLYWIPFLRWAQTARPGLRERMFVVHRASSGSWYDGIGAGAADLERLGRSDRTVTFSEGELQGALREQVAETFALGSRGFRVLPAELVAAARSQLARESAGERSKHVPLEVAPLAFELPARLELPDTFVAVCLDADSGDVGSALAERIAVVEIDRLDRSAQGAVLGRARGYVGRYGVEAFLAVLVGRQAVALSSNLAEGDRDDLQLASSLLSEPPFGSLRLLEAGDPAVDLAARALRLLDARASALAGV